MGVENVSFASVFDTAEYGYIPINIVKNGLGRGLPSTWLVLFGGELRVEIQVSFVSLCGESFGVEYIKHLSNLVSVSS